MKRIMILSLLLCLLCCSAVTAQVNQNLSEGTLPRRAIALTIDDLPMVGVQDVREIEALTGRLLSALKKHQAPAIGFVNENKLFVRGEVDARIEVLRMWLDAGHMLGNHTFAHTRFQDTPLDAYQNDVIRGEVVTRQLMKERGITQLYFRHPYTSTGPTREAKEQFEAFLNSNGYRVAPFTIEHADYLFNSLYEHARSKQDSALLERIRLAYLDQLDTACAYIENRSREVVGYEVRQILLIHTNRLNAECLDEMLARLKKRGYSFISLDEALQDKAYQLKDEYIGPLGISWVHRWSIGLGQENKYAEEPDPPKFIFDLAREIRGQ